ncbi:MAG: hypothetical protein JXB88_06440 [Spirochaetales bacterium]|nr:hypothetical protein [Spirochaetales bacterium]
MVKKRFVFISSIIICFIFFYLHLFSSCLSDRENQKKKNNQPKAYWNQEEYDRAIHKIHQPRNLFLSISIWNGNEVFSNKTFCVYTGRQKYGSEDAYFNISLNEYGKAEQKIDYNHSFIGIELTPSLLPVESGIAAVFFSWYNPGTWVSELSVDIDVTHFSNRVYPSSDDGFVRSDLFYYPGFREKKVWVCFESLFVLTSTRKEHPQGLIAKEAEIKREEDGRISIILNMPGFFRKWNKNYASPWQEGDIYPVSISISLTPPAGFFRTVLSGKQDLTFVPKNYNGKVEVSDGDPYLFIPSTDSLEEVIINVNIDIPVTSMILK